MISLLTILNCQISLYTSNHMGESVVDYIYLFDVDKYVFVDDISKIDAAKHIVVAVNNKISIYSDKLLIIDMLFRLFDKYKCFMSVITLYPEPKTTSIKSVEDLLKLLCDLNVSYNPTTNPDMVEEMNKQMQNCIIKLKYVDNIQHIILLLYDKSGSTLNISPEAKQFVKYIANHKYQEFIQFTQKLDIFIGDSKTIIFKNDITDDDFINKIKNSDSVEFIVYKMLEIYAFKEKQEINNITLRIIDFFDIFLKIVKEKNDFKYTTLVNICKEWIFYLKLIFINSDTNFGQQINKTSVKHISFNKVKKMISSSNITDIKTIENKINHNHENILNSIKNIESVNSFYFSRYSLSGWKEEVEEKSCLGLVMSISIPDYSRSGKCFDDVWFNNTTKIFLSTSDYINTLNSNERFTGDPEKINFDNLVLPMYINKYHWMIAKCYLPLMLGLAVSGNICMYNTKFDNIYYLAMNKYFELFVNEENCESKIIYFKLWASIFRTSIELSKEKNYHKGMYKYCDKLLLINPKTVNFMVLFGQMASVGFFVQKNGTTDLEKFIVKNMESKKEASYLYLQLSVVTQLKKKLGGFKNMIKSIDENNGCFPKDCEDLVIEFTKK